MVSAIQSSLWSSDVQGLQGVGNGPRKPPDPEMMFQQLDTDGDGRISTEELSVLAAEIEEKTGQTLDVEQMFADYDQDQDGLLSRSELDEAMKSQLGKFQGPPPMGGPGGPGGPEPLFEALDQDQDGTISQSELEAFLSQVSEESGQSLNASDLLAAYDSDQDGLLSFEDFDSLMKNEIVKGQPPAPPASAGTYAQDAAAGSLNLFNFTA